MTLKTRILSAIIAVGVLPLIVASGINYFLTSSEVSTALQEETSARLVAMREEKAEAIQIYIDSLDKLMHTLARSQSITGATRLMAREFGASFTRAQTFETPYNQAGLADYFSAEFGRVYREKNGAKSSSFGQDLYQHLDDTARFYQSRYIADNTYPLGEKDKLENVEEMSLIPNGYDSLHTLYHRELRYIQQEYGFYDLFLIDNDGRVIYSVYKETDYATSLANGPFSDSGLATAWRRSQGAEAGAITMTDFDPYTPSYEAPASFLSTPVFDDATQIGTLVIQLPVALFTEILTSNQSWQEVGMGDTGLSSRSGQDRANRDSPFPARSRSV